MRIARGIRTLVLLIVLASPVLAAGKPDPDAFRSDAARIELRKPAGWHFQTLESAFANRAAVKMNDEEFQKAVAQMASAPLVVATRHVEPYDSLNPSFQVIVRPLGTLEGRSGVEILRVVEPALRANFADFATVDSIRATSVAGQPAARMTIRYTLRTQDDREYPTRATLVMVPRGKVLYQLGFSGPPTGPDAIASEVDSVLASVRFLD